MTARLYVDFNNREEDGRIRMNLPATKKDMRKHQVTRDYTWGLEIIVHDTEIESRALLERGCGDQWFARLIGKVEEL